MESVFWVVSKIAWAFIAPETLLLILMILSAGLLWTRYNKQGRVLISFAVFIIILVSVLPFSSWILRPLEDRFPIPKKYRTELMESLFLREQKIYLLPQHVVNHRFMTVQNG